MTMPKRIWAGPINGEYGLYAESSAAIMRAEPNCFQAYVRADMADALAEALRCFTFPGRPDAFQSPDGGCTEAIVDDASVQIARAALRAYEDQT